MECDYTDSNYILVDVIIDGVKSPKVQERLLDKGQFIEARIGELLLNAEGIYIHVNSLNASLMN